MYEQACTADHYKTSACCQGKALVAHQGRQWCRRQQPGHLRRRWQCSAHCQWAGGPQHTPCAHGAWPAERAAAQLHLHRAGVRILEAMTCEPQPLVTFSLNLWHPSACRYSLYDLSEHQKQSNQRHALGESAHAHPGVRRKHAAEKKQTCSEIKQERQIGCLCSLQPTQREAGICAHHGRGIAKAVAEALGCSSRSYWRSHRNAVRTRSNVKACSQALSQQPLLQHPQPVPST